MRFCYDESITQGRAQFWHSIARFFGPAIISFNLLQHLNEAQPDSFLWFIKWLLMQMILSQFLPTVHWYSQFLSMVHWYISVKCSLMSSPKLWRNSLENSLQKNISLQHYQEKLSSQRERFWGQVWKARRENTKKGICFLWTASADCSPEFLRKEASSLEVCVHMQGSGQYGEGLGCISCKVYDQRRSNDIGPGPLPLDAVWPLTSALSRDSSRVMERQVFLLKSGDG